MTKLSDFYKGKRVLITGHTGFKGAWLTRWLLKIGAEVYGYSIDIPTHPALFEILKLKKEIHHHVGDIRNIHALRENFKDFRPDVVFHLAAQSLVRTSYDESHFTFDTNVMGTVNVLECIRDTSSVKSAVIVTSDKCYETELYKRFSQHWEDDRIGGSDPYSASKACAELVFRSYYESFFKGQNNASIVTARAGNVIGGGDWAKDRLIPDCYRAWSSDKPVKIRNPSSVRPWQHVLEALNGYLCLARDMTEDPTISGQSFNFGPKESGHKDVCAVLIQLANNRPQCGLEIEKRPDRPESSFLTLNIDKAQRWLSWKPILSFEQAISMTAEWYECFYSNKDCTQITDDQILSFQKLSEA